MSRDNKSPNDPIYDPESADVLQRLSEIERQLKKARPRPVELDGAEIELAFRATRLPPTPRSRRRSDRYRWATLAGTWASGALVGAVLMFLVMRSGTSGLDSMVGSHVDKPTPATQQAELAPVPPKPAPQLVGGTREWSDLEAAVLALSAPDGPSAYARNDPSLSVGMHLPHFVAPQAEPMASTGDSSAGVSNAKSSWKAPSPDSPSRTPSPGTTRQQLLHDLLNESSEVVL